MWNRYPVFSDTSTSWSLPRCGLFMHCVETLVRNRTRVYCLISRHSLRVICKQSIKKWNAKEVCRLRCRRNNVMFSLQKSQCKLYIDFTSLSGSDRWRSSSEAFAILNSSYCLYWIIYYISPSLLYDHNSICSLFDWW